MKSLWHFALKAFMALVTLSHGVHPPRTGGTGLEGQ